MIAIMSLFDALARLADREVTLHDGETLFRSDDGIRSMFLVASGAVRLVRQLPHGPELTMQLAEEGSILAEASLFATRYHCDAVAVSEARLLVVPRPRAEAAVTGDPVVARLWGEHLAIEVQRVRAQVETVLLKTVAERLDAWLALKGALPPRGQWQRLASEIGVSSEALYRELARRRGSAGRGLTESSSPSSSSAPPSRSSF